jgi:hypothetical protein
MAKEPILTFVLSKPDKFHCSFCGHGPSEGAFSIDTDVSELIEAFKEHVQTHHPKGEDFSQAAARIVRQATENK